MRKQFTYKLTAQFKIDGVRYGRKSEVRASSEQRAENAMRDALVKKYGNAIEILSIYFD